MLGMRASESRAKERSDVQGVQLGGVDFSNLFVIIREGAKPGPCAALAEAKAAGAVTINYGVLLSNVVTFLIVAIASFFIVRGINALRREQPPAPPPPDTKECRFCASTIACRVTRCAYCTSRLST